MIRLLLVEDDTNLSYMVKSSLEDMIGGYEVLTANNGEEGLSIWKEEKPEVIISDIEMPVLNGFEMVRHIRETDGDILIIFASGLVSAKDVERGYKLGVNNYVKKPFIPEELDAHIQALLKLKKGQPARNEERQYRLGHSTFLATQYALKDNEGNLKTLTVREAGILELLCRNKGSVVKRESILSEFWNVDSDFYAGRSLDVFMNNLRKSLAEEPAIEIKTVRGVGYILSVRT
ncbi:response regulator transcription factor [Bacteroides sp.]|uniref:response regulator transcription factor n=1 Tax=Bacteroides sp. TaxID=29523 RepID=UPI002FC6027C|nr:response regulator transcription factor [Bacteroides sp.]